MNRTILGLCTAIVVGLILMVPGTTMAQLSTADTYKVEYFAYAHTSGAPDATLRILNTGQQGDASPGGDLCANIYVFHAQQLQECCGCLVTPDETRILSVNNDVTGNPLTGIPLVRGVIKIVSSKPASPGFCDPTNSVPTQTLRAWSTHVNKNNVSFTYVITEGESQDAPLSTAELNDLNEDCMVLLEFSSGGPGICSCGTQA